MGYGHWLAFAVGICILSLATWWKSKATVTRDSSLPLDGHLGAFAGALGSCPARLSTGGTGKLGKTPVMRL